jgi:hypothetical protein
VCELQQGAEVSFSEDEGTWEVISVPRFSAPIPVIDDADLLSEGYRPKCPGALGDPQLMTGIVIRSIGTAEYPTKGLIQDMTITHGLVPGNAGRESYTGSGFIVDVRTPEFNSDTEGRKTIEVDWQFDGKETPPARTLATVTEGGGGGGGGG